MLVVQPEAENAHRQDHDSAGGESDQLSTLLQSDAGQHWDVLRETEVSATVNWFHDSGYSHNREELEQLASLLKPLIFQSGVKSERCQGDSTE